MQQIHELLLTLMTLWFPHNDLFQNEVMSFLHVAIQLQFKTWDNKNLSK